MKSTPLKVMKSKLNLKVMAVNLMNVMELNLKLKQFYGKYFNFRNVHGTIPKICWIYAVL